MTSVETGYQGWTIHDDKIARRLTGGGINARVEECDPGDLVADMLVERARAALRAYGFGLGRVDLRGLRWWMHPLTWHTIGRRQHALTVPDLLVLGSRELFGIQVDDSHGELYAPDAVNYPLLPESWGRSATLLLVLTA